MLMSGLMIFNAHPRLYWGQYGANADPAWLEIGSDGGRGYLRVGAASRRHQRGARHRRRSTAGVQRRAFPGWATIPSAATTSRWRGAGT